MPEPTGWASRLPGLANIAPALSKVLAEAGYTPQGLSAAMQPKALAEPNTAIDRVTPYYYDAAVVARRLASSQLSTLVKLFLAGSTVTHDEAAESLRPLDVDTAIVAGLLARVDGGLQAAIRIGWCDRLLVGHDWHDGRPTHREDVVGVAQASLTLADLTVRRHGIDALDVGTGGGVQALLAADHAKTVTGTDINPRALDLAAFGAALNGLPDLVWREGSLLEPVAGDTFDLITINPPFIISPDNAYFWRDAGSASRGIGGLCQLLAGEAARSLRPDGWASMLASWIHDAAGDWSAPVRSWLRGLGCDAWVLRFSSQDPLAYAHTWLGQTEPSSAGFTAALDRWLEFYLDQKIDALATGAIILHRTTDSSENTWADDMPTSPTGPAGEQIQRAFRQRNRLSRLADRDLLLEEVLTPLPGTTLDQTLYRRDGAYHPAPSQMRVQPGLSIGAAVSPTALPVLLELDGEQPLRELVRHAVEATGFDADEVAAEAVATARRLIELGLVEWR